MTPTKLQIGQIALVFAIVIAGVCAIGALIEFTCQRFQTTIQERPAFSTNLNRANDGIGEFVSRRFDCEIKCLGALL